MGRVLLSGLTEENTSAIGKMENNMVRASILWPMAKQEEVYGNKVRENNGWTDSR